MSTFLRFRPDSEPSVYGVGSMLPKTRGSDAWSCPQCRAEWIGASTLPRGLCPYCRSDYRRIKGFRRLALILPHVAGSTGEAWLLWLRDRGFTYNSADALFQSTNEVLRQIYHVLRKAI